MCGLFSSKSNIKVWDAKTHKKVLDIKGHTNSVTCVNISSELTKLATGSKDKRVYVWNMKTGKRLLRLPQDNDHDVVAVRFSPKGDRIATSPPRYPRQVGSLIYSRERKWEAAVGHPMPILCKFILPAHLVCRRSSFLRCLISQGL